MRKMKSFYIISGLRCDSSQLGHLNRFDTEKEAIDHAHDIIQIRSSNGKPAIAFHILKATAIVQPQSLPIRITKYT